MHCQPFSLYFFVIFFLFIVGCQSDLSFVVLSWFSFGSLVLCCIAFFFYFDLMHNKSASVFQSVHTHMGSRPLNIKMTQNPANEKIKHKNWNEGDRDGGYLHFKHVKRSAKCRSQKTDGEFVYKSNLFIDKLFSFANEFHPKSRRFEASKYLFASQTKNINNHFCWKIVMFFFIFVKVVLSLIWKKKKIYSLVPTRSR